jgi:hypothetical protein
MNINQNEKEKLYRGFDLFREAFSSYIISLLKRNVGDKWKDEFLRTLSPPQLQTWEKKEREGKKPENLIDFQHFKFFAIKNKDLLRADFEAKTGRLPTLLEEIVDVRNSYSHFDPIEEDEAIKAWINMRTIAKLLGMGELEQEIRNLEKGKDEEKPQTIEVEKNKVNPSSLNTETAEDKSAKIDEAFVAINIAKQYPHVKNAEDLYNCTRGLWRLSKQRAEKAKYAFAVYKRIIKEVYEIHQWVSWDVHTSEFWVQKLKSQGTDLDPKINEGRYQFIGEVASDVIRDKYIGRELPEAHAQNPIRYFNC